WRGQLEAASGIERRALRRPRCGERFADCGWIRRVSLGPRLHAQRRRRALDAYALGPWRRAHRRLRFGRGGRFYRAESGAETQRASNSSGPVIREDRAASRRDDSVEAVIVDAPVELRAAEPQHARGLRLVPLGFGERPGDEAALHVVQLQRVGRADRRTVRHTVRLAVPRTVRGAVDRTVP